MTEQTHLPPHSKVEVFTLQFLGTPIILSFNLISVSNHTVKIFSNTIIFKVLTARLDHQKVTCKKNVPNPSKPEKINILEQGIVTSVMQELPKTDSLAQH